MDGFNSIFPHKNETTYDFNAKIEYCKKIGLHPNFNFIKQEFGEIDSKYSNIIFVNGGMDPWLPGCVNE